MPQAIILSREDLRARDWSHSRIRALTPSTTIKTGKKGRPAFGYKLKDVVAAERSRSH